MDSQNYIEYECIDCIKDKSFVIRDYFEAVEYYKSGWIVVEKHITKSRLSLHTSVEVIAAAEWTNNPEFEGDE